MVVLQELNETRTRLETTIEETDGRVQEDYEHRLREALQELRSQYEEQSRASREETEYMFTSKVKPPICNDSDSQKKKNYDNEYNGNKNDHGENDNDNTIFRL